MLLARRRVWYEHARRIVVSILRPNGMRPLSLSLEWCGQRVGQHHAPIGLAHCNLCAVKIQILHPQSQPLHEAHARSIQQSRDQAFHAFDGSEQMLDL